MRCALLLLTACGTVTPDVAAVPFGERCHIAGREVYACRGRLCNREPADGLEIHFSDPSMKPFERPMQSRRAASRAGCRDQLSGAGRMLVMCRLDSADVTI
jgi:hypothetical protein